MKTTYYVTLQENAIVMRATTSRAKRQLAISARIGLSCKAIEPRVAKQMIKEGAEFIKIQDL